MLELLIFAVMWATNNLSKQIPFSMEWEKHTAHSCALHWEATLNSAEYWTLRTVSQITAVKRIQDNTSTSL